MRRRVGVIGIGFGQSAHVPAFRADARCEVTAISASTQDRARAVAERLGVPKAYGDWRALVADPEIDIVSVAVPPALQAEIAGAAARHGKAVFCEKPIALTLEQARQLRATVNDAGVAHAIDLEFQELPAWVRAKELCSARRFGTFRHVDVSWHTEARAARLRLPSWKLRPSSGGGALGGYLPHVLYGLEWLFGRAVAVTARLRAADGVAETGVDAWIEMADRGLVKLCVSTDAVGGDGFRMTAYAEGGGFALEQRSAEDPMSLELRYWTGADAAMPGPDGPLPVGDDARTAAVARVVSRFMDSIETGASMHPDLGDGLRVQELIDAVQRSDRASAARIALA